VQIKKIKAQQICRRRLHRSNIFNRRRLHRSHICNRRKFRRKHRNKCCIFHIYVQGHASNYGRHSPN
jgi:hypothetical protein